MTSKAETTRRTNYHYMADAMRMLEWDLHQTVFRQMRIPDEWHRIAREKDQRAKTRVTLRLDEDVVKFFRSMGPDWQVRVNRIIATWMHARLAGLINGPETMDYMKRENEDEETTFNTQRPHWGDEMSWTGKEMLEQVHGKARMAEMDEGDGVPLGVDRKPSAVLKAEYWAMKGWKGE